MADSVEHAPDLVCNDGLPHRVDAVRGEEAERVESLGAVPSRGARAVEDRELLPAIEEAPEALEGWPARQQLVIGVEHLVCKRSVGDDHCRDAS